MHIGVLGEWTRIQGYALAGARLLVAEDAAAARAAWHAMAEDIAVVILTRRAAAALEFEGPARPGGAPLMVVMPP